MGELSCRRPISSKKRERPRLVVEGARAARQQKMLASIDLNLLLSLEALLEHRNVTHAARHVRLSQPSMSRALTRLRGIFNDDILVRGSSGLVPTPQAERLAQMLPPVLDALRRMVNRQGERRSKTIMAIPDHQALILLPPLLPLLREHAPNLDIVTGSFLTGALRRLEQGEIDLAVGQTGGTPPGFFRRRLYTDRFACLLRCDHPALAQEWTIETFAALRHAAIGSDSKDGFGRVHDDLANLHLQHCDPVLVSNLLTTAVAVAATDLVLIVPHRVATRIAALLPLAILDPPVELSPYEVGLIWHERCHRDPEHHWLRHKIAAAAAAGTELARPSTMRGQTADASPREEA
ncbi:LysR family transcriptional regulator [Mesorhizobium sp.]|uniref:LysR family transcriptional regulator n=1 Tax=Mesorhizobium sp. TaxID=1871066 RepID=UPI000FE4F576|nr:LysR family transcriptional regulator [Mesorhizobium sp.]RWO82134.1 MAG: LysR family transcriptional regulator [Mesorhizobium sp.]RWQ13261.1 MAG: LysR family transcriptional regulator [Mesorhizobium sp.]TIN72733.1 MAG: LysR family transcriptional regulator [Mesorhizobium sp.]TIN90212.1 MAG: LysR family transcriptional regulator [Mesorhizobium sp.]